MKRTIMALTAAAAISMALSATGCADDSKDPCKMEPNAGSCEAYIPSYYYDGDHNECEIFYWGGCDGTVPFDTLEECEATCVEEE